ncbi:MAG: hypothetical protein IKN52_18445, partial [Victivallales bacterium]|nr:hypothetical protein [Victivallales bacterium]
NFITHQQSSNVLTMAVANASIFIRESKCAPEHQPIGIIYHASVNWSANHLIFLYVAMILPTMGYCLNQIIDYEPQKALIGTRIIFY